VRVSAILEWQRRRYSDVEGGQVSSSLICRLVWLPPAVVIGPIHIASHVDDTVGVDIEAGAFIVVVSCVLLLVGSKCFRGVLPFALRHTVFAVVELRLSCLLYRDLSDLDSSHRRSYWHIRFFPRSGRPCSGVPNCIGKRGMVRTREDLARFPS